MRLGLCCTFLKGKIRFRTVTARPLRTLEREARGRKLRELAAHNAEALRAAVAFCAGNGIGCFRVTSQILPLKTHPELGYGADMLGEDILSAFRGVGDFARERGIRLSFHPDQFVVLSSPDPAVVQSSLTEIEYQAEVAEWIGADVINIHGGGGYGDKGAALRRLADSVARLSPRAQSRLTLENDDRVYTPRDLLPVCEALALPLVYDVHHHRCNPDDLTHEAATERTIRTWRREPLFHVSSPRDGWRGNNPRSHSDYINPRDFPRFWDDLAVTVEVEAKAKELAVRRLVRGLARRSGR